MIIFFQIPSHGTNLQLVGQLRFQEVFTLLPRSQTSEKILQPVDNFQFLSMLVFVFLVFKF